MRFENMTILNPSLLQIPTHLWQGRIDTIEHMVIFLCGINIGSLPRLYLSWPSCGWAETKAFAEPLFTNADRQLGWRARAADVTSNIWQLHGFNRLSIGYRAACECLSWLSETCCEYKHSTWRSNGGRHNCSSNTIGGEYLHDVNHGVTAHKYC
jgi:hypothetical protein